jgi:hypothetical protein
VLHSASAPAHQSELISPAQALLEAPGVHLMLSLFPDFEPRVLFTHVLIFVITAGFGSDGSKQQEYIFHL